MKTLFTVFVFCSGIFFLKAQQLVYKPINPAFGGETFNYQWLLSSAAAQNQFDNSNDKSALKNISSVSSFSDSLNRQMLSQLSSQLFKDQFGSGDISEGNYMMGSLYLQITNTNQGMMINILDTTTGDQSEVVMPK